MSSRTLRPELKEFAMPPPLPWGGAYAPRRLAGHIVRSEGYSGHAHPYSLFEEMEDKDPHLFSLLQTRKLGLLARPVKMEAGGESPADRQRAAWVERVLATTPGWHNLLFHLLDALAKGLSVVEILWDFNRDGQIVPRQFKPRAAGRFMQNEQGQWLLLDPSLPLETADGGRPLPERKFLTCLFGASDERPYGKGLDERVYWHWWFKKHNIKFWLIFNEKFGSPTVIARHRPGLGEEERRRLLDVIEAIQNEAGVTLPDGINLELLEAHRSGSFETYESMARWCNDEMSRAILGQTLTSGEGARSGSLALGKVHESVRQDYLRADAQLLMDVINGQLIRWLTDLNWGPDAAAPRWQIDLSPELNLEQEVMIDRQLLQMGVPLPLHYFHDKYGRPAPGSEANRLQYDDSNLFYCYYTCILKRINPSFC